MLLMRHPRFELESQAGSSVLVAEKETWCHVCALSMIMRQYFFRCRAA